MVKTPNKVETPSPTSGNEVANPERFGSDPMQLHLTMTEVQKELTSNTTVLSRAVVDIDKQLVKIDSLLLSFAWFKGVFAATAVLIALFAGLIWWLIGTQISDLKNELMRRMPPPPTTDSRAR
jgi:hypothetical protein